MVLMMVEKQRSEIERGEVQQDVATHEATGGQLGFRERLVDQEEESSQIESERILVTSTSHNTGHMEVSENGGP